MEKTKEIQKKERPVEVMTRMLDSESVRKQFSDALGDARGTFTASLVEMFSSDAKLQECKPSAVISEALRAASLRLPIGRSLGYAYVLPFLKSVKTADGRFAKEMQPVFVIGYKGLIQLAIRSGYYRSIHSTEIYEGEEVTVDRLTGIARFSGEKVSDRVTGYLAHFELLNGFEKSVYMSVKEMANYAVTYSPTFRGAKAKADDLIKLAAAEPVQGRVGWEGIFNEMAKKTVLRRLLTHWGFLSIEMMNNINGEDDAFRDERDTTTEEMPYEDVTDVNEAFDAAANNDGGEVQATNEGCPY